MCAYVPVAKPDTSHAGSPIPWTRIADSSSGDLAVVRATVRYIAEAPDGLWRMDCFKGKSTGNHFILP